MSNMVVMEIGVIAPCARIIAIKTHVCACLNICDNCMHIMIQYFVISVGSFEIAYYEQSKQLENPTK